MLLFHYWLALEKIKFSLLITVVDNTIKSLLQLVDELLFQDYIIVLRRSN